MKWLILHRWDDTYGGEDMRMSGCEGINVMLVWGCLCKILEEAQEGVFADNQSQD